MIGGAELLEESSDEVELSESELSLVSLESELPVVSLESELPVVSLESELPVSLDSPYELADSSERLDELSSGNELSEVEESENSGMTEWV